jgi:hypothetical protein
METVFAEASDVSMLTGMRPRQGDYSTPHLIRKEGKKERENDRR